MPRLNLYMRRSPTRGASLYYEFGSTACPALPSADDFGVRPLLRPLLRFRRAAHRRAARADGAMLAAAAGRSRPVLINARHHASRALVDAPDAVVLFQEAPGAPALVEVAPTT